MVLERGSLTMVLKHVPATICENCGEEYLDENAAAVEALVADWGPPFCDGWESFRPDPAWPIPRLSGQGAVELAP